MNIKSFLLGCALLCAGSPLAAQVAYKGQLYINQEKFTRQGELLRVQLRVSYDDNILNSGETLNFTPVLKSGTQLQTLSSVVVNGSEREKYEKRSSTFAKRLRRNVAVVTSDKRHGTRYFLYDTTVPYAEWMGKAALYVESEERGWGRKPHVYEDCVFNTIHIGQAPGNSDDSASHVGSSENGTAARQSWVQFLNPTEPDVHEVTVTGTIALDDNRHLCEMKGQKFNTAIYDDINNRLSTELRVPGTTVGQLRIVGYGAPIGNYHANEERSADRALSLKNFLMTNKVLGVDGLSVTWIAEDWDSIATLAGRSDMKLKKAVLDIISTVPVVNGREDEIEHLGGGAPYAFMKQYIFPKVRRLSYTAQLLRRGVTTDGTVNGDSHAVSLTGLVATAQNFSVGSREYNDIVDLTARLFPDNAEANINAAGVALMRGNVGQAEQYLRNWQTDPRAYNNIGVMYMLQGNWAKAEVYLEMAQARGVKEATEALNYLRNVK